MLTRVRTQDGHTHRFTITRGEVGWDVREERDSRLVREAHYTDWHRVERAMRVFEIRLGELAESKA